MLYLLQKARDPHFDKSVTINRLNDVTTVTVRDRNTGEVSSETFFGDSPFGN